MQLTTTTTTTKPLY